PPQHRLAEIDHQKDGLQRGAAPEPRALVAHGDAHAALGLLDDAHRGHHTQVPAAAKEQPAQGRRLGGRAGRRRRGPAHELAVDQARARRHTRHQDGRDVAGRALTFCPSEEIFFCFGVAIFGSD
ncbi:hypothetical protein MCOR34_011885, partial [Pyricularia oryzae]